MLVFLNLASFFMSQISFITLCILSCKIRIRDTVQDLGEVGGGVRDTIEEQVAPGRDQQIP